MDWKSILTTVAPTVVSALGSPLAGMAVSALGSAFGIDQPTQDKIAKAITGNRMTPEQVIALKTLENDFIAKEREMGFKFAELAYRQEALVVADRNSARKREEAVNDGVNRELAYLIVIAFVVTTVMCLFGVVTVDSVLAGTLIGYLSAKCEQVLSYYFGSSKSSDRKTELLAQSPPVASQSDKIG